MTTPTAPASDPEVDHTTGIGGSGWVQSLPPIFHSLHIYGVEAQWIRRDIIGRDPRKKPNEQQLHPQFIECKTWLESQDGVDSARKLLNKVRLGFVEPKDVVAEALGNIWTHLVGNPDKLIVDPPGYCYRVMDRVVLNMLNGRSKHRPIGSDTDDNARGTGETDLQREELSNDVDLVDAVRVYVEASGRKPGVVSAVLTYVVLIDANDIDCDDLPSPRAGAHPDQARWWPCLWLAYRDDTMFPEGGGGSAAQRKRLQHAKDRSELLMKDFYATRARAKGGVQ
jgi:hypothetical protein